MQEQEITLKELFSGILRKWRVVLAFALMAALALGGFQTYKQMELAAAPENTPEQIEQRYAEAMEVYERDKAKLESALERAQLIYDSKQKYIEESFAFKLDPYNEYVSYITLSFTDINEETMVPVLPYEGIAAEYMVNTIRAQYIELWKCADAVQAIDNPQYADLEEKYLRELINVEATATGGFLEIRAYADNFADAESLANNVYNYLSAQQEKVAESSYAHQLLVVNQATKCIINEATVRAQESAIDAAKSAEEAVSTVQDELNALAVPQKEAGYATSEIVKAVLKFAAIGLVGGIAAACFGICCMILFGSKVNGSHQMERMTNLRFLGTLKTTKNVFERMANRLMDERVWRSKEQAGLYLAEELNGLCGDEKQLLVLSTLSAKKAQTAADELAEVLKANGYSVKLILDAAHNPETIRMMRESKCVLLAESVGASQMSVVLDVVAQAKAGEKQILGFAMI